MKKTRERWMDGPPGSKLKMNNMRGGLGMALLVMEQTLLNLPQGEVDEVTASFRELMNDAIRLVKLRMSDLIKSPSQRKFVKLNDVSSSLIQFTQAYQTLVGYTTRAMEVPVEALQAALGEADGDLATLDKFLEVLDQRVEEARKTLELGPGESVIDLGPEAVESAEEEEDGEGDIESEPVKKGQMKYMKQMGYIGEDGRPTGMEPQEGEQEFVWVRLGELRAEGANGNGDPSGV